MATRVIDDTKLNDIAVAIQSKDSGGQMTVDEMPTRIEALPEIVDEDAALVLIDWEGTLLRSYTRDEVMALTALPNPSTLPNYAYTDHEWLVFQEWNWSLAGIKSYCQKYPYMSLYVAAIYNPSDGQDHYEYYNSRVQNEKYAKTIKLARSGVIAYSFSNLNAEKISIPNNFSAIEAHGFKNNKKIEFIGFPKSLTFFNSYSFNANTSLKTISLPETFSDLRSNTIGDISTQGTLKQINLPEGISTIYEYCFRNEVNLTKINIPSTTREIRTAAFNTSGLLFVWLPQSVTYLGSQPFAYSSLLDVVIEGKPTASYSNIFAGCDSNLKIYVPQANLSWFSTETNWADIYAQYQFVAIEDNIEYLESLGFNVDEYKEVA